MSAECCLDAAARRLEFRPPPCSYHLCSALAGGLVGALARSHGGAQHQRPIGDGRGRIVGSFRKLHFRKQRLVARLAAQRDVSQPELDHVHGGISLPIAALQP
jgi:hypothetical protein